MQPSKQPRTVGQYVLGPRLGHGGMAEVYLATQTSLDRQVAIKVMLPHLAHQPQFIARFQREANAAGRLRHPHIMAVFDFGVEGDTYYMVMEYVQGGTLRELLASGGPLPLSAALLVTAQVADALAYAHRFGMIHRDLKPANVMFTDSTHTHAVLGDFGIARLLGDNLTTTDGKTIGTPAYMSPEVIAGQPAEVQSDLYGLGVMLYEMLTGKLLYTADHPMAILMQHIQSEPPDMGDMPWPAVIKALLLRLLAKNPAKRFASAEDVRDLVNAILNNESVTIQPPHWTPDDDTYIAMLGQTPLLNVRLVNSLPIRFDQNRVFHGRSEALYALRLLLAQDGVVVVHGKHGIGKTALVCRVLGDLLDATDPIDGIVSLSAQSDDATRQPITLNQILSDFQRLMPKAALRLDEAQSATEQVAQLLEITRHGRYYLLLDHLDSQQAADGTLHADDVVALVAGVMERGGLTVVATTTKPLNMPDQPRLHQYALNSGLSASEALQFMHSLPASHERPPDDELLALIDAVDGHPRALEAATDWISLNPLGSLDELLDELMTAINP